MRNADREDDAVMDPRNFFCMLAEWSRQERRFLAHLDADWPVTHQELDDMLTRLERAVAFELNQSEDDA